MEDQKISKEEKSEDKIITPLDSNFPLLRLFREKAPGSHKHSQSLVSMVDNVCSAIDMDPEILKIAAMYHDVGKMLAPWLYTENQGDDNPHDELPAWVSFQLITRHVSDSVMILTANDFPPEIIQIVSQHHGDTVLRGIFKKATSENKEMKEDEFRYATQRPSNLMSLILMLCDNVEAGARSVYRTQGLDIAPDSFVFDVYNKLHADGQFDDVEVRLGVLKKIQEAVIADVASDFQKRVAYPENKELSGKEKIAKKEEVED